MEIVINDTNVFIDLITAELLDKFFLLPIEVHTTDFIIHEITEDEQQEIVQQLIDDNKLKIRTFDFEELIVISDYNNETPKLSIPDCSVMHYAIDTKYTLLSGDGLLRKIAKSKGATVKGVLYILDSLVEHEIITPITAAEKLQRLVDNETRLPPKEVEKRKKTWL